MRALLPWLTTLGTLTGMWLAGNRNAWGWVVGLANQVLWVTFAVVYEAWGLLPLAGALVIVYSRNLAKWRREDKGSAPFAPSPSMLGGHE